MTAIVVERRDAGAQRATIPRMIESLKRQGFGDPLVRSAAGVTVGWFPTPLQPGSNDLLQDFPCGWIACVGTFFFRGQHGAVALRAFWHWFSSPECFADDALAGEFLLVLAKEDRVWVGGDALGMIKLYEAPRLGVFSSSWLACVDALSGPTLDRRGALEYVLEGANHSVRTPVQGVEIVQPGAVVDVCSGSRSLILEPAQWPRPTAPDDYSRAVDEAADMLREHLGAVARAFGHVRASLSGGFDSRLVLAGLLAAGCRPELFVYGAPADPDVRIAGEVGSALSLPLRHCDKEVLNRTMPPLSVSTLQRNLLFMDGIPPDGVVDRGADRVTRLQQSDDGAIALNGGGGEILRNFFYLPDRPFSVEEIVGIFYSGYHPGVFADAAERRLYAESLARAIEAQIGLGGRLPRVAVELIYPLFRNRYWTSRNNSIAARTGHFETPLLERRLVSLAAVLPIHWKDAGRFESAVIARLDKRVAVIPMSYGFTPQAGPGRRYRLKMALQNRRPPWLRARAAQIKAFGSRTVDWPALDPNFVSRTRELARRVGFETSRMVRPEQIGRLCTLQAVADYAQLGQGVDANAVVVR